MRRELVLPLGVYLAVTLVAPALNGAIARPGFFAHAAWTAGVVAAFGALVLGAPLAWSRMRNTRSTRRRVRRGSW